MIYSKKLSRFKEIIHGFATRQEGDIEDYLAQNPAVAQNCVLANQIHEDNITLVGIQDKGKTIKETDGLVTSDSGVVLGVKTADCVPMLFYEPNKKIVGVVHAGWRGTLLGMAEKMVKKIKNLGGNPENIVAAVGPHIGLCCYDIDKERAKSFEEKFGIDPKMISFSDDRPHLDLAYVNFLTLLKAGVKKENLDVPPSCTSCQKYSFFSYRRSKKEGDEFGEMLAIIGMKI